MTIYVKITEWCNLVSLEYLQILLAEDSNQDVKGNLMFLHLKKQIILCRYMFVYVCQTYGMCESQSNAQLLLPKHCDNNLRVVVIR